MCCCAAIATPQRKWRRRCAPCLQVRQVVCNTPAVEAGLALLERGGDFAAGVIAFEGELLGGTEFMSFDQQAVKRRKAQKRKARLLAA